ncbi:discoidin domain-containing protein [Pedobacter sp. NJ-S-72]
MNDPNVNNEEGTGVNHDYNAIAWSTKPIGVDSFYVEEKISDLEHREDNMQYELKVDLVHQNGTITETIYPYTFLNGLPVLNFSTRDELSKKGWAIASFSSQETSGEPAPNGPVANVIDGNSATYWHTSWSANAASYPHQFVVDMGSVNTAKGLSITQRGNIQRTIKDAELWYSSTDGINFTKINSYTLGNIPGPQYFDFASPIALRYFKFIAKSSWDGEQFAALAEIGLY